MVGNFEGPAPRINAKELQALSVYVSELSGYGGTGADWTCRGNMTVSAEKYITLGTDTDDAPATSGRLKVSGAKIWFDNGTTWEIVTSAA